MLFLKQIYQKSWVQIGLIVLVVLMVIAATPMGAAIRAKLLCATEEGNCVEGWNGTDIKLYSDAGSTSYFNVEGSVGAVRVAVPTSIGTATPAMVIDSAGGLSRILEVRDSATPVWYVGPDGSVTSTGAQTYSGGQTVNNWLKVAAPTAIATATPAMVVDSSGGVSNIFEIRDSATPVAAVNNGGNWVIGLADGTGVDVTWYSDTAGDMMLWDQSEEALSITGTNGQNALIVADGDIDLDDNIDVNGTANLDEVDIDGAVNVITNTEHVGMMTVLAVPITYTAAAGGTGAVATIADGEVWLVHKVLVQVTTNFDATGDDATLVVGDGNVSTGFVTLADTELQAADTEGTGFAAGWQGQAAATIGAYLDANENGFIYAPSGAPETIDWLVDETSGETLTAGAATIYVFYTRIY